MSNAQRTPVVPLEAGAGPENPPCPACGEPLFGWLSARPGLARPGQPLRELRPRRRRRRRRARRRRCASSTASGGEGGPDRQPRQLRLLARQRRLGRAGPGGRYLFTVEAVRRLVARRDQVVKRSRWAPVAGLAATWQTLLNSVTFGHNVALGRARARRGRRRRSSPGSAGSTPWPASCWRSRRCSSRSRSSWPAASSAAAPSSAALRAALSCLRSPGKQFGRERAADASDRGRRRRRPGG